MMLSFVRLRLGRVSGSRATEVISINIRYGISLLYVSINIRCGILLLYVCYILVLIYRKQESQETSKTKHETNIMK